MKTALLFLPFILISVSYLIYCELAEKKKQIYFIKPLSTTLVILAAMLSLTKPGVDLTYSIGVIAGLILCLGGDIALMFQHDKKLFRAGLVLFLLGHISYTAVFTTIGTFSGITFFSAAGVILLGSVIYGMIRNNLGSMKLPVIAYILIISIMIVQASGVYGNPEIERSKAALIFSGAVLFYISDVMLAANRFFKPWKYNRISLAFYYSGQLLIALSTGF